MSELLGLINADRSALGRRVLITDEQLWWVAQWRAEDMAARDYLSHCYPPAVPCPSTTANDVLRDLFGAPGAWENAWSCAAYLDCTAGGIHAVFMASPDHRGAVLVPGHTHAGLGFARSQSGALFVVELFATQE